MNIIQVVKREDGIVKCSCCNINSDITTGNVKINIKGTWVIICQECVDVMQSVMGNRFVF